MSGVAYRTKELAPDWRREPSTSCFCGMCQRDMRPAAVKFWVAFETDRFPVIIHPGDFAAAAAEIVPRRAMRRPSQAVEFEAIGIECAKKVRAEWLLDPAAHNAAIALLQTWDTTK